MDWRAGKQVGRRAVVLLHSDLLIDLTRNFQSHLEGIVFPVKLALNLAMNLPSLLFERQRNKSASK